MFAMEKGQTSIFPSPGSSFALISQKQSAKFPLLSEFLFPHQRVKHLINGIVNRYLRNRAARLLYSDQLRQRCNVWLSSYSTGGMQHVRKCCGHGWSSLVSRALNPFWLQTDAIIYLGQAAVLVADAPSSGETSRSG